MGLRRTVCVYVCVCACLLNSGHPCISCPLRIWNQVSVTDSLYSCGFKMIICWQKSNIPLKLNHWLLYPLLIYSPKVMEIIYDFDIFYYIYKTSDIPNKWMMTFVLLQSEVAFGFFSLAQILCVITFT